jgi:hypothetical protein
MCSVVIPARLRPVLLFFGGLAWIGLTLSVLSHLAALFGSRWPLGDDAWFLHIGIFIVWIPTVLVASRLSADFKRKDMWKAALRGYPDWMKYMVYGFFGYAFLNFVIFLAATEPKSSSSQMTPEILRGFSGHWMAFYSAAAAVLYSATRVGDRDQRRKCFNGHAVGPLAQFCEQCGQPVV